ncbi:unnamed protein product [Protopolystoma xenopodis]|uniref:Uncharacterized protein n=1 Tax=Protopolystoma xenopodis TaxID=117903 RepID=A0A448WX01_9PLAT|nr:unnamed protein product [Protopolystoma xenopodis]
MTGKSNTDPDRSSSPYHLPPNQPTMMTGPDTTWARPLSTHRPSAEDGGIPQSSFPQLSLGRHSIADDPCASSLHLETHQKLLHQRRVYYPQNHHQLRTSHSQALSDGIPQLRWLSNQDVAEAENSELPSDRLEPRSDPCLDFHAAVKTRSGQQLLLPSEKHGVVAPSLSQDRANMARHANVMSPSTLR